jgi:tRNA splicing endonuclease
VYGEPDKAPETKVFMDVWKHPLNPSYTSVQVPQIKMLPSKGYALVEEELAKRELDEEILKKENEILIKKLGDDERDANNNNNISSAESVMRRNKNKLNVDDIELPPSSQCGLAITSVAYKSD